MTRKIIVHNTTLRAEFVVSSYQYLYSCSTDILLQDIAHRSNKNEGLPQKIPKKKFIYRDNHKKRPDHQPATARDLRAFLATQQVDA